MKSIFNYYIFQILPKFGFSHAGNYSIVSTACVLLLLYMVLLSPTRCQSVLLVGLINNGRVILMISPACSELCWWPGCGGSGMVHDMTQVARSRITTFFPGIDDGSRCPAQDRSACCPPAYQPRERMSSYSQCTMGNRTRNGWTQTSKAFTSSKIDYYCHLLMKKSPLPAP